MASMYWSIWLLIFSANILVDGCKSAFGESGMIDPYPRPAEEIINIVGDQIMHGKKL